MDVHETPAQKDPPLVGRRFVVTGAARGIGAATVRAFVANGAAVACLDLRDDLAADVAAAAAARGGSAFALPCDVTNRAAVDSAFAAAVARLGGLDGVAHVAGIQRDALAEEITAGAWDEMVAANATATFHTNQAAFPYLKDRGGSIINFTSAGAIRGQAGSAHYAASKAAVAGWTRTAAQEWGRYNIRVNAVAPAIRTPMYEEYRARLEPGDLAAHDLGLAATIPLGGRLGSADRDMAPVMVFLAGDASRFVTGQVIAVDGGLMMLGS